MEIFRKRKIGRRKILLRVIIVRAGEKSHWPVLFRMIIKTDGVESFLIYFSVNIKYVTLRKLLHFYLIFDRSADEIALSFQHLVPVHYSYTQENPRIRFNSNVTELSSFEKLPFLSIRTLRCNAFRITPDIVLFQHLVLIKLNTRLTVICI